VWTHGKRRRRRRRRKVEQCWYDGERW